MGPAYYEVDGRSKWFSWWPDYEQFQFDRNKIEILDEIGEGEFGKVYLYGISGRNRTRSRRGENKCGREDFEI